MTDILDGFVRRGMLPKELPPNFTSAPFADALAAHTGALPFNAKTVRQTGRHSLARHVGVRRLLGIANPVSYYGLAGDLAAHWGELTAHFTRSEWGSSTPELADEPRSVTTRLASDTRTLARLRQRARGRYLVLADIAEFYGTLYTHSIPWALHGKADVKHGLPKKDPSHWGNQTDYFVRQSQYAQTNGIPIGPDTSFVIGEVLLCAINHELQQRTRGAGFRFYDDYEIVTETYGEAENALAALQDVAGEYNLHLNPRKSCIVTLPHRSEPSLSWVSAFSELTAPSATAVIDFFDRVFEHRTRHPESRVASFAISRLAEPQWPGQVWQTVQSLMYQAVVTDAGALHQLVRSLVGLHVAHQLEPDADRLAEVLSLLVRIHAPRGHGSEVAWALWAASAFKVDLPDEVGSLVSQMNDDVVALLALRASDNGELGGVDPTHWQTYMNANELNGEHWLLAYEADLAGFLPAGTAPYVSNDPEFGWLAKRDVRFTKDVYAPTQEALDGIGEVQEGYDGAEEEDLDAAFFRHVERAADD